MSRTGTWLCASSRTIASTAFMLALTASNADSSRAGATAAKSFALEIGSMKLNCTRPGGMASQGLQYELYARQLPHWCSLQTRSHPYGIAYFQQLTCVELHGTVTLYRTPFAEKRKVFLTSSSKKGNRLGCPRLRCGKSLKTRPWQCSLRPDLCGYSNGEAICTEERNKKSYPKLLVVRGSRVIEGAHGIQIAAKPGDDCGHQPIAAGNFFTAASNSVRETLTKALPLLQNKGAYGQNFSRG